MSSRKLAHTLLWTCGVLQAVEAALTTLHMRNKGSGGGVANDSTRSASLQTADQQQQAADATQRTDESVPAEPSGQHSTAAESNGGNGAAAGSAEASNAQADGSVHRRSKSVRFSDGGGAASLLADAVVRHTLHPVLHCCRIAPKLLLSNSCGLHSSYGMKNSCSLHRDSAYLALECATCGCRVMRVPMRQRHRSRMRSQGRSSCPSCWPWTRRTMRRC